jgi:hypothetical protein
MKKIKHMLIGFILGTALCIGLPVFAEALNIVLNPFPVLINGVETEVEGYNINGSTFLKLADFKKAGLTVKFNETDRQIEITSADSSTAAPSTQQNNISGGSTMIEYDATTGLPVGAEYVEYQGCTTAVEYNGNTFMSRPDLSKCLGISCGGLDVKTQTTTYNNGGESVIIDMTDKSKYFVSKQGTPYINVNQFQ